jgi:predicted dehydrogenase
MAPRANWRAGQHLPALVAMREEGGLPLSNGDRVMPDVILVGRSAERLAPVAQATGFHRFTDDLGAALANAEDTLFFDVGATGGRVDVLKRAIAAGKHIYTGQADRPRCADGDGAGGGRRCG